MRSLAFVPTDGQPPKTVRITAAGRQLPCDIAMDAGQVVVTGGPGVVRLHDAPLAPVWHTLLLGIRGGGGWDFRGLALDPGATTQPPVARPIVEFVGDSITCGSPTPIEAADNYSWRAAESLGCDHTQIAWPGRARSG